MIIVLKPGIAEEDILAVEAKVRSLGYEPHTIKGEARTVIAAVGDESLKESLEPLFSMPVVENVLPIQRKYKLISRETHPETTRVTVGNVVLGGGTFHVIAGPCSVESEDQMMSTALGVKEAGATLLRGGVYKPRTSPYSFQGLGDKGLAILQRVREATGLPIVTEVVREADIPKLLPVADILQIGARNALNYGLLEAVGATGRPIMLKRGMSATLEEWLLAAEYIVKRGNRHVILCERGIRTFETATRNTLDLSAVALAKKETTLPVFVDPSHAAGRWDLISDLSKAAVAVGADGLMIEVHRHPESALSDGAQQLTPQAFAELMRELEPFVQAAGKKMGVAGSAVHEYKRTTGWGR